MANKEERKKPTYLVDMTRKFKEWSQIDDEELDDAMEYASGNMYFELRKMTSLLCQLNEKVTPRMIKRVEKDISNDKEFLKPIFKIMTEEINEIKNEMKTIIDSSWRDMVEKQKVGFDKISIILVKDKEKKLCQEKKEEEKK